MKTSWIDVMDRLPEESGYYITADVRMTGGYVHEMSYSAVYHVFNAHDNATPERARETALPVTHWMPLPEPPFAEGVTAPGPTDEDDPFPF